MPWNTQFGRFFVVFALFIIGLPSAVVYAQTTQCDAAAYRQFDFWLGDWVVTLDDGTEAGRNTIRSAYNGCVITEHYQVKGKPFGESLNIYDSSRERWYQFWVDRNGTALRLSGGIQQGSMVLSGEMKGKDGVTHLHQITWTPQQSGDVVQHWQVKTAEKNWSTLFRGTYSKNTD